MTEFIAGEITKNGDLKIAGNINTRLPAVLDGLVAHFPFDKTARGDNHSPIMDYSIWEDGQTGSVGSFGQYGGGNSRVMGVDPWGSPAVVWKGVSPSAGIYHSSVPIDNTKLYRMSWWEKRVTNANATNGRYYAGLNGYGSTNGVCNLGNGLYNTNPYFWNTQYSGLTEGEWFLFVGFVFPHDHTGTSRHPESGIYKIEGTHTLLGTSYKWGIATTSARSRTLAIYQGDDPEMEHHTVYPRMEICDGTEPTIQELLTGESNILHPAANSHTTFTSEGIAIEEETLNIVDTSAGALGEQVNTGNGWTNYYDDGNGYYNLLTPLGEYNDIAYKAWRTEGGTSGGIRFGRTQPDTFMNISPSTTYTASYYIRVKERDYFHANFIYLRQYDSNGASITNRGVAHKNNRVYLGDGWYRIWGTFTTESNTERIRLDHYAYDGNGNAVWFFGGQLEQKKFMTSFTKSNRSSGSLYLDNLGGYTEYTVCGIFKPRTPFSNASPRYAEGQTNSSFLWAIYDTVNPGYIGFRYWESSSSASAPYLNRSGAYGSGNNHRYYELSTTDDVFFIAKKNSTSFTLDIYQNGYKDTHTATVDSNARLDNLRFGHSTIFNATWKDLSIYNRALSENEIKQLRSNGFHFQPSGDLTAKQITTNDAGWQMVFHGLATQSIDPSLNDGEIYENHLNHNNEEIQFNQMRITSPYWDQNVVAETTKTAVLNHSFKWYVKWLFDEPDGNSPKMKFHGLDGLQDVGFTSSNAMLFGYGNSWRRITPIYYVTNPSYMYHGQVPSYILYEDWGSGMYNSQMLNDTPREGGMYSLTPREYQEMIVWVRMKPQDESEKINMNKSGIQIQGDIKTGQVIS